MGWLYIKYWGADDKTHIFVDPAPAQSVFLNYPPPNQDKIAFRIMKH